MKIVDVGDAEAAKLDLVALVNAWCDSKVRS